MTIANEQDLYYDPYDFEIDADPYPVWKRLRDEAPLYWNDKYEFFALSRWDDVDAAMLDWKTYISGRGSVLEMIRADVNVPPGNILFEDPPLHDIHRSLLSRVFTPKKMAALEPQVRAYCAQTLDPLVDSGEFDFVRDLGAFMPMRTIGMLLGIPEEDQEALRERTDEGLRLEEGTEPERNFETAAHAEVFGQYIDWRAAHPSDDLMTEMLNAEFEDEMGVLRKLTRDELLMYTSLVASAGNETTTRLIGFSGEVLARHPGQRRQLVEDRSLVPNAVEELLRYESPSPIQSRYVARDAEWHGQKVPEGSVLVLLNGSANRDERHFPNGDEFDIHREIKRHQAFGYGIHLCLGAALARLEGRVALDEVLTRFPEWEVDYDRARRAHTSSVRGWESLPVHTA
jgi:cytochrome P450